jgi:hypothetical protein
MKKYLTLFNSHAEYEQYVSGDFEKPNVSHCVQENEVHYNPYVHDYAEDYLTFVAKGSGTFTFTPQDSNVISYSTDGGENWTEGNSVSVNNGDEVLWKGTMTPSIMGIGTFSSTGQFDAQGNVMSLLYGDDFKGETTIEDYALSSLFYDGNGVKKCNLVNANNLSLPATTLADYCYYGMFYGCTSLTTAPELPATTLTNYCYYYMFYGCTSLTTAPELPATTLANYCYYGMFSGCINLTTAPELPATTLANYCYYGMFNGCTSLTTAPELPATTLASNCYSGMFYGCTSLVTAPSALPATTLTNGCYDSMLQGCTSLVMAPELPATTLATYCYRNMFNGCTKLNYIKAMFTTTPSTKYTDSWVSGVAASGIFVKNSAATWTTTGTNGIPTGWAVETAST